jgi:hypothetical protein
LLTCEAVHHEEPHLIEEVHAAAAADGMTSSHDEALFEFLLSKVNLIERTSGSPFETQWRPEAAPSAR